MENHDAFNPKVGAGAAASAAVGASIFYAIVRLIIYIAAISVLRSVFERIVVSLLGIMYMMQIGENTLSDIQNHTEQSFGERRKFVLMGSITLVEGVMILVLLYTIFISGGII